MSKIVVDQYITTAEHILGSNNTLVVTPTGVIDGADVINEQNEFFPVVTDAGTQNNSIIVDGILRSGTQLEAAIDLQSTGSTVTVGATGLISGSISAEATNDKVVNEGHILATRLESGVDFGSVDAQNDSLDNSGSIAGYYAAVFAREGTTKITNEAGGRLIGEQYGIEMFSGSEKITNHGLIQGELVGIWDKIDGAVHIVNDGTIKGGISLGTGSDTIDTRGGKIVGTIDMGWGTDTLITDNASYHIDDAATTNGFKIVKSTVSYVLNDGVDTLDLIGSRNINATGNDDSSNYLNGNSGNNVLDGKGGYNELFGYGGDDTLIGGSGVDLFGFGKGYAHDTIEHFTNGQDTIDLEKFKAKDFEDLQSHIEKHGKDVWIDMGSGDLLVIKHATVGEFDASDFSFDYFS